MEKLNNLYNELYDNDVLIFDCDIPFSDAAVIEMDGKYGLFVDTSKFKTTADETVAVAHESGHIFTGSTHKHHSCTKLIEQHENRADKWAVKHLIPVDELDVAIADGCTEIWELAERFGVTEQFMRKAVCYYVHGNLATELYF